MCCTPRGNAHAERLAAQLEQDPGKFGALAFAHKSGRVRKITHIF
jgi:hypothetical protein